MPRPTGRYFASVVTQLQAFKEAERIVIDEDFKRQLRIRLLAKMQTFSQDAPARVVFQGPSVQEVAQVEMAPAFEQMPEPAFPELPQVAQQAAEAAPSELPQMTEQTVEAAPSELPKAAFEEPMNEPATINEPMREMPQTEEALTWPERFMKWRYQLALVPMLLLVVVVVLGLRRIPLDLKQSKVTSQMVPTDTAQQSSSTAPATSPQSTIHTFPGSTVLPPNFNQYDRSAQQDFQTSAPAVQGNGSQNNNGSSAAQSKTSMDPPASPTSTFQQGNVPYQSAGTQYGPYYSPQPNSPAITVPQPYSGSPSDSFQPIPVPDNNVAPSSPAPSNSGSNSGSNNPASSPIPASPREAVTPNVPPAVTPYAAPNYAPVAAPKPELPPASAPPAVQTPPAVVPSPSSPPVVMPSYFQVSYKTSFSGDQKTLFEQNVLGPLLQKQNSAYTVVRQDKSGNTVVDVYNPDNTVSSYTYRYNGSSWANVAPPVVNPPSAPIQITRPLVSPY